MLLILGRPVLVIEIHVQQKHGQGAIESKQRPGFVETHQGPVQTFPWQVI